LHSVYLRNTQNDIDKHLDDVYRLEEPKQKLTSIIHKQRVYIYT